MQNHPLLAMALLTVLTAFSAVAEETPKGGSSERRYQLGPLVAEDFRGTPPPETGRKGKDFAASVETVIKWNLRYRFDQMGKTVTLRLTDVDVYSAVVPQKSYNKRPTDRGLMDHEQGHFDLAEISALELRIKLTDHIRHGKPLTVVASSEREANAKVDSELQRLLADGLETLRNRNQQYDEITDHGDDAEKQKLQRDEQKKKLKELQEKMREMMGRR